MKSIVLGLFVSLFASITFAVPVEDYVQILKDVPMSYEPAGAICEQVAREEMKAHYPVNQYDIVTGIAYGERGRTLGELDVIVFNRTTNTAVMIAEVKCWKDLNAALSKALSQRKRFITNIRANKNLLMVGNGRTYSSQQFRDSNLIFTTISQAGGKDFGFDYALEHDLHQLMYLRGLTLRSQSDGTSENP